MSPTKRAAAQPPSTCPWCSSAVPARATSCPSCGAQLKAAADAEIVGVTQIDPAAIARAGRSKSSRGGLASWLTGDRSVEESSLPVAPVSEEVKREMLRMELAALDAELEAKKAAAELQRDLPPEEAPA